MPDVVGTEISKVKGFKVASVHCGLKPIDDLDFILIVSDSPCSAAGIYTSNQFMTESVKLVSEQLEANPQRVRAIAVNTGCANAFTGDLGRTNGRQVVSWIADRLGCDQNEVIFLSLGQVGMQLPMENIRQGIDLALASLGNDWESAAHAIQTTDKTPKLWWRDIYGVRILGIAAARICILVSDALIAPDDLQDTLYWAVDQSFDQSIVDGETTPDEAVIMLSNGASGIHIEGGYQTNWGSFGLDVRLICDELAWLNVKNETGATKIVQIRVMRAPDNWWNHEKGWSSAKQIAHTIATSISLKVGFYNNQLEWGYILAAAGCAGVPLELEKMSLWIVPNYINHDWPGNALALMLSGEPTRYDEQQAKAIVGLPRFNIVLDCGLGSVETLFTTCDLSRDYVSANSNLDS